jgi:hypothetical protein
MKLSIIFCFLTLFVWDKPAIRDTSQQEAQAATGRDYTAEKPQKKVKKLSKKTSVMTQFKPARDQNGMLDLLVVFLSWIGLGWWALVASPLLLWLLMINTIAILLGLMFFTGQILSGYKAVAGRFSGGIGSGIAGAAAGLGAGCALAGVMTITLIVLLISTLIILLKWWVLLIVLGSAFLLFTIITLFT